MNDTKQIMDVVKKDALWWLVVLIGMGTAFASSFVTDDDFLIFKMVVLGSILVVSGCLGIVTRMHSRRLNDLEMRVRLIEVGDVKWK